MGVVRCSVCIEAHHRLEAIRYVKLKERTFRAHIVKVDMAPKAVGVSSDVLIVTV